VDVVSGGVDDDGFCSFEEQPATVSVSSAPHSATRRRYLGMLPNLCNMSAPLRGPPHRPVGLPVRTVAAVANSKVCDANLGGDAFL
jgi:hypothetical protein